MSASKTIRSRYEGAAKKFAASKPGGWFYVNVFDRIDPHLLRWSKGRFSLSVGFPILLMTHRGAKSGQERETALLFTPDDPRIILVASKAGATKNPAWYHNLKANPEVEVIAPGGRTGRYRAHEAEGEERARAWQLANELYPGYDVYETRTGGRRIPVMVLERVP